MNRLCGCRCIATVIRRSERSDDCVGLGTCTRQGVRIDFHRHNAAIVRCLRRFQGMGVAALRRIVDRHPHPFRGCGVHDLNGLNGLRLISTFIRGCECSDQGVRLGAGSSESLRTHGQTHIATHILSRGIVHGVCVAALRRVIFRH